VVIQATAAGTGDGSFRGLLTFNALNQQQRPALTLANGQLYIAFGSRCDNLVYHGWILSYNPSTLQQTGAYVTPPNGTRGGIAQAGQGITVDTSGNLYIMGGNGTFDGNTGGMDFGESVIRLSSSL